MADDDAKAMLQSHRAIYVGGLSDDLKEPTLRAALIPFGPIKSIDIVSDNVSPPFPFRQCMPSSRYAFPLCPTVANNRTVLCLSTSYCTLWFLLKPMDYAKGHHKGFAFVEYEDSEVSSLSQSVSVVDQLQKHCPCPWYLTQSMFSFCPSLFVYNPQQDAAEAIDNMDGAELMGRFLSVSLAQANQMKGLKRNEAIWTTDEWFQEQLGKESEAEQAATAAKEQQDAAQLKTAIKNV